MSHTCGAGAAGSDGGGSENKRQTIDVIPSKQIMNLKGGLELEKFT